ncbi:hypothetical protein WI73_23105 [Burkholderia ubonensis]|nr:hypothetical protein WI73_23105 [Burkholderia ubonensis]
MDNMNEIDFDETSHDALEPRIGGGALIGGVESWPTSSSGEALHLIASLPATFLGIAGCGYEYVSVFSFYSANEYFLDRVTYHGDSDEMEIITRDRTTRVIFHAKGTEMFGTHVIPARTLRVRDEVAHPFHGSGIGGHPGLLQDEDLSLPQDFEFAIQLYSGDFPDGWTDIFGLSDALGYLFVATKSGKGLFFVQVT